MFNLLYNFNLMFVLLLDTTESIDGASTLLQYGILGIFALLMIIIIRYQDKINKDQQEKLLDTFTAQNKTLMEENKTIKTEKDAANATFLEHLKCAEEKLLTIVSENSTAFKQLVTTSEAMTSAIKELSSSIKQRDESAGKLNDNLIKIIDKK